MARDGDIVLIGAAGRTGSLLLGALAQRQVRARALVRHAARAAEIGEGHQPVVADLADIGALKAAFAGAKVVHFIPPLFIELEEQYAIHAIAAAEQCKVRRFIYHSVLHADTPQMPHHARKARVERRLRDSALAWTIVQPSMYVSTPLLYFDRARRLFRPPFDVSKPFSPIDTDDLSEAVANILCEDGHEFASYELAGPAVLTIRDMAAIASKLMGSLVEAVMGRAEEALAGRGFTLEREREARAMYAHYTAHGLPGNGRVLAMILRRAPRSFEDSMASFLARRALASQGA